MGSAHVRAASGSAPVRAAHYASDADHRTPHGAAASLQGVGQGSATARGAGDAVPREGSVAAARIGCRGPGCTRCGGDYADAGPVDRVVADRADRNTFLATPDRR